MAIAYSLVFATGQFTEACKDWKQTLIGHKTWSNFKIDFGLAFKQLRESQQTAQGAGFATQNTNHTEIVAEYAAETAKAIENLANAAVQNQVAVQKLTNTNTMITQNLMEANQQSAQALSTIASLQGQGGGYQFGGQGDGRGRGGGRGEGRGGRGTIRTVRVYNNENYCHTHGYDIHDAHTSETCNTPGIGHCHDATLANNRGGSQKNRSLVL